MTIILDMGSGLTCKNDIGQVKDMIRSVSDHDPRTAEIILKWQLFQRFGELEPLHHGVFSMAYDYAIGYGYSTTASVFDRASLRFLLQFTTPFVKIACLRDRMYLGDEWRNMGWWESAVVASYDDSAHRGALVGKGWHPLACVREYPATVESYETRFSPEWLSAGLSDHTDHSDSMYLFNAYRPAIYETHYCLPHQTGPDTGSFALRPLQLEAMLEGI